LGVLCDEEATPLYVQNSGCSYQPEVDSFDITFTWIYDLRESLFVSYVPQKCLNEKDFCSPSCKAQTFTTEISKNRMHNERISAARIKDAAFKETLLFHSESGNPCDYNVKYNPKYFLAQESVTCRAPLPDSTEAPLRNRSYLSFAYLALLILPFVILFLAAKRIRDAYVSRRICEVSIEEVNSTPMVDVTSVHTPVQIFAEYPMNHVQPTPVYTYSQPGVGQ